MAGGTGSFDDLDRADCILLVGANPTEAHPVVGARLKQLIRRGARLIVIDPRRTELAEIADVHLAGSPGSNVAVFHGIAHLLVAGGHVDEAFIQERASGYDELLRIVGDYDPDRVARIAAVSADDLRSAARLFGTAERPAIVYGLGVTELCAWHRRRTRTGQPGHPARSGGHPRWLRHHAASRPEQCPRCLRHGCTPGLAAGLSAGDRCRRTGSGRIRVGSAATAPTRRTANLVLLPDERLDVHPQDAARLGVSEGGLVLISSRRGQVTVPARVTETVSPGQVFLAFHFPGAPVNRLTSGWSDEVTGCPEYKVTAVNVQAAHGDDR